MRQSPSSAIGYVIGRGRGETEQLGPMPASVNGLRGRGRRRRLPTHRRSTSLPRRESGRHRTGWARHPLSSGTGGPLWTTAPLGGASSRLMCPRSGTGTHRALTAVDAAGTLAGSQQEIPQLCNVHSRGCYARATISPARPRRSRRPRFPIPNPQTYHHHQGPSESRISDLHIIGG